LAGLVRQRLWMDLVDPHFDECSPGVICELYIHLLVNLNWNISYLNCCFFELATRGSRSITQWQVTCYKRKGTRRMERKGKHKTPPTTKKKWCLSVLAPIKVSLRSTNVKERQWWRVATQISSGAPTQLTHWTNIPVVWWLVSTTTKQFVVCTSGDNEYKRCCISELEGQANMEWEDLHLKVARVNQHPQLWLHGLDGCQLDIIFFHWVHVPQLTPLIIFLTLFNYLSNCTDFLSKTNFILFGFSFLHTNMPACLLPKYFYCFGSNQIISNKCLLFSQNQLLTMSKVLEICLTLLLIVCSKVWWCNVVK
jgi:hypothetical protein